jgi:hypothetical protein
VAAACATVVRALSASRARVRLARLSAAGRSWGLLWPASGPLHLPMHILTPLWIVMVAFILQE